MSTSIWRRAEALATKAAGLALAAKSAGTLQHLVQVPVIAMAGPSNQIMPSKNSLRRKLLDQMSDFFGTVCRGNEGTNRASPVLEGLECCCRL